MSPNNEIDYKKKILECLENNTAGLTITDIAKKTDISRNTIYRYIDILEENDLVFKKKVGAYHLYFTKERDLLSKGLIYIFYKGLLSIFKEKNPNIENLYKEIGRSLAKYVPITLWPPDSESMQTLKKLSNKFFLKTVGKFLPYLDPLKLRLDLKNIELNEDNNRVIYHYTNVESAKDDPNFINHYYLLTGYAEVKITEIYGKRCKCDIQEFKVSENPEDIYINISLEITD
jgi:predicted transcriptional regulator